MGGLTLAGTAGLLGLRPDMAAGEAPPETTRLRLAHIGSLCAAPQFVARELLNAEGFTDIQSTQVELISPALASGDFDIGMSFAGPLIIQVDTGDPIVLLAGIHAGCYELFGTNRIRAIRDLKGKTVAVTGLGLT